MITKTFTYRLAWPLTAMLVGLLLMTGCASQRNAMQQSAPETVTVEEDADFNDSALSAEEAALLEDDFENWDDEEQFYTVADPIEPFNRVMFAFNEKLYGWLLKPLALGYRKVAPVPVRTGVGNFFHNLTAPIRFVNCILQGKGQAAAAEFASFAINSTWGLLGIMDHTKNHPELNPDPEDLGQTLGRYSIGDGFYIVWPFIGTSTLRDTVGRVGDAFLDPINYVEPTEAAIATRGGKTVNTLSFRIEDIDAAREAALDPYEAARNFYIQSRQSKIKK